MCIGDIGGVLLPVAGDEERVERLMRNWTGVRLADIERVAAQGMVILVAIGENKAGVLLEVLRRGLCTHLLVDTHLFNGVNRLVYDELPSMCKE